MNYYPVIGLEVHIELATKSKLFCGCSADHFAKKPNSQVCPTCLGLPGALPFANKEAIDSTIKLGLALGARIATYSKFDRKHYFYPDLPKSYQISQYDLPFCSGGSCKMDGWPSAIQIRRIHLEEDTGKLVHAKVGGKGASLVDFNRSSVPLVELVTEPIHDLTIEQIAEFVKEIQRIVRYLGISNADMEKGSMRLEANISLAKRKTGDAKRAALPDYKVELKNINSFKFMVDAVKAEVRRQTRVLESGDTPVQETRGYDESKRETFSQRTKEEAHDYRYFPEPDIPPITLSGIHIEKIKKTLPVLPQGKRVELAKLGVSPSYIEILVNDVARGSYFEKACALAQGKLKGHVQKIADAMVNLKLDKKYPEPSGLIKHLLEISNVEYVEEHELEEVITSVLAKESAAVTSFKEGKTQILGFFMGEVQKKLHGRADPKKAREILLSKLA